MTPTTPGAAAAPARTAGDRPPAWLVVATLVLALACLLMSVMETSQWGHYMIDQGEFLALVGLAFIAVAGVYLHRHGRLAVSLPLVAPWLLYPVITQGDQIIDNLSINAMRTLTHVLLAAIFGTPVLVIAMALRYWLVPRSGTPAPRGRRAWVGWIPGARWLVEGRAREGSAVLVATLLSLEIYAAHRLLGSLMVATLIAMIFAVLLWGTRPAGVREAKRRQRGRWPLVFLLVGVATSFALYLGYKNRPGAYQGSPSYLHDPSQAAAGYAFDRIPVSGVAPIAPSATVGASLREALDAYGQAFEQLVAGYYIVDRNYTYHFHNELFMRAWPVLPNYRAVALARIAQAQGSSQEAARLAARAPLDSATALGAFVADIAGFADFTFERAHTLERLTADFERSKAGLQHAAHLYEGEGTLVGQGLGTLFEKHRAVVDAPVVRGVIEGFVARGRAAQASYANRIVGF